MGSARVSSAVPIQPRGLLSIRTRDACSPRRVAWFDGSWKAVAASQHFDQHQRMLFATASDLRDLQGYPTM